MRASRFRKGLVLALSLLICVPAFASSFRCEVLGVKGTVTARGVEGGSRALKEGDLLEAGETVEVDDDSYADLAYDKDWQNITRLEANTKIKIASIASGKLELLEGGVFAKLKKLPQDSTFEVQTPTAVATVRGSVYRTTYLLGQTDVFNEDRSRVIVYGVKEDGTVDKDTAVMLEQDKKTNVPNAGKPPVSAAPMTDQEKTVGQALKERIDTNIEKAQKAGRASQIQSVDDIEKYIKEEKRKKAAMKSAKPAEFSRVTDDRRRPFGGDNVMAPPEPPPAPEEEAALPAEMNA
jgi:hypothetical protein